MVLLFVASFSGWGRVTILSANLATLIFTRKRLRPCTFNQYHMWWDSWVTFAIRDVDICTSPTGSFSSVNLSCNHPIIGFQMIFHPSKIVLFFRAITKAIRNSRDCPSRRRLQRGQCVSQITLTPSFSFRRNSLVSPDRGSSIRASDKHSTKPQLKFDFATCSGITWTWIYIWRSSAYRRQPGSDAVRYLRMLVSWILQVDIRRRVQLLPVAVWFLCLLCPSFGKRHDSRCLKA
jgi:hypothetical protein